MDIQRIFPRKDAKQRPADAIAAAEDAGQLALQAAKAIDDAVGSGWYAEHGNRPTGPRLSSVGCDGHEAGSGKAPRRETTPCARRSVRRAEAVVWLASRAISYMDENGFPEAAEPYIES